MRFDDSLYILSSIDFSSSSSLNPDAILHPKTLNNFLNSTKKFPNFAIMGPAKQDEYSTSDKNKDEDDIFEVEKVKGFAMFLNLEQCKEVGFFDENFFIYFEEIDFCRRLIQTNKKIFLDTNIKINHAGGTSHDESINHEMEKSRNWHWMWSTFYFHYNLI